MKLIISEDSETHHILIEFVTTLNQIQTNSGKMQKFAEYIMSVIAEQFVSRWIHQFGFDLMDKITPEMIAHEIAKIRTQQKLEQ